MIVKVTVRSPACIDARVNAGTIERKLSEQQEIPIPTAFLIIFLTDHIKTVSLMILWLEVRILRGHQPFRILPYNLARAETTLQMVVLMLNHLRA
jgi:hypothetical protein